jgi:hypothetical protein
VLPCKNSLLGKESLRNTLSSWALMYFYQPAIYSQLHLNNIQDQRLYFSDIILQSETSFVAKKTVRGEFRLLKKYI